MTLLTWKEIKEKIQRKHGIETDESYDEFELIDIANEAINMVESEVITLQQDYFLTRATIQLIEGESEYDLPADIFANKIRRIFYKEPDRVKYKLKRAKDLDDINSEVGQYDYNYLKERKYIIINLGPNQRKILLSHAPKASGEMELYYTRNSNRFTVAGGDSQVCDIPEFADAVMAWMSYLIEFKDKSPTTTLAKEDYNIIINNLRRTLTKAVADEDNSIDPDTEFYDNHV